MHIKKGILRDITLLTDHTSYIRHLQWTSHIRHLERTFHIGHPGRTDVRSFLTNQRVVSGL